MAIATFFILFFCSKVLDITGIYSNSTTSGSIYHNNTIGYINGLGNIKGIYLNSTSSSNNEVSINTISNFNITNNVAFTGIDINSGTATVNTVQNNIIENIIMSNTGTSSLFSGINVTAGLVNISTNTIGHTSNANSINISGDVAVTGIKYSSSSNTTISSNLIANINAGNTGTNTSICGILHSGTGVATITGNLVKYLSTPSSKTDLTTGIVSAQGITITGNSTSIISGNSIYEISGSGTAASNICGISENAANIEIAKNVIYNIRNTSSDANATASGIILKSLASTNGVNNNMISVGTDSENPVYSGIYLPVSTASFKNI